MHGCRANFPDGLRPLKFLCLDALLPLGVGDSEGGAGFAVGFCTLIPVVLETTLVSSRTLSFCFPLTANSLSSFNTTESLVTLDHCTCFDFLKSGVKISQSKFLICAFLHHRFQCLTIGHRYLLDEFPCRTILIQF